MKIKLTQIPDWKTITNEDAANYMLDNNIETVVIETVVYNNDEYDLLDVYSTFKTIRKIEEGNNNPANMTFEDYDSVTA